MYEAISNNKKKIRILRTLTVIDAWIPNFAKAKMLDACKIARAAFTARTRDGVTY